MRGGNCVQLTETAARIYEGSRFPSKSLLCEPCNLPLSPSKSLLDLWAEEEF